jgi:hypothetical protein
MLANMTLNSNPDFQPLGLAADLYDSDTKLTRFVVRDYTLLRPLFFQRNRLFQSVRAI